MAWRKLLALGFITSGVVIGCTVSSDDGSDTDGGSQGDGATSTGGASGGDAASGGSTATGGASSGGSTGTGGTASGGSTGDSGPLECNPAGQSDLCEKCIETACCTEWKDCSNDADCTGSDGELALFHACMTNTYNDAGTITAGEAQDCLTNNAKQGVPATASQDLVTCILAVGQDAGTDGGAAGCADACYHQTF